MKLSNNLQNLLLKPEKVKTKRLRMLSFRYPVTREYIRTLPLQNEVTGDNVTLAFIKNDSPPYDIVVVSPEIYEEFPDKAFAAEVFLATTRQKKYFFWPVAVGNGKSQLLFREFAETAQKVWCAICGKGRNKEIKISEITDNPTWPDTDSMELLDKSLKSHRIDNDDPILQRWRGFI